MRRNLRAKVGPGYQIRFRIGQRYFTDLAVTDLGGGGCSFAIPAMAAELVSRSPLLEDVEVLHPSLPVVAVNAQLAWLHGRPGEPGPGMVHVGIAFLNVPEVLQEAMEAQLLALQPTLSQGHGY